MAEPSIRRAGPHDVETLVQLGRETFTETFGQLYPPDDLADFLATAHSPERVRRDLQDADSAIWLVEADGRAVGYALAGPCELPHPEASPAAGELKRIYLRSGWRNGGVGRRLFAAAMDWLARSGRDDIWIGVWSENFGAQRFYERFGFVKVGEYLFPVGRVRDREFILRRQGFSFSG